LYGVVTQDALVYALAQPGGHAPGGQFDHPVPLHVGYQQPHRVATYIDAGNAHYQSTPQ
jgi:hypothetical protein